MPAGDVKTDIRFATGLSAAADPIAAAEAVCEQAGLRLGSGAVDLGVLFFTPHHAEHAASIVRAVRERLGVRTLIGASVQAVIGGARELEDSPGLSLLTGRLPGVSAQVFTGEDLPPMDADPAFVLEQLGPAAGFGPELRGTLMLADPFSAPMVRLLPALNKARRDWAGEPDAPAARAPIVGGLASGSRKAGGNRLLLNERILDAGLVGVSLSGPLRIDTVVSQGCRGFGPTMLITRSKGNIILELGGKPALFAVRDTIEQLDEASRAMLDGGLFIGRVINEYKDRFGRDDFLVRGVVGVDQKSGAVAVGDLVRTGQTVRLHLRDARSAGEDLALLLDGQQLREKPAGALCITCTGRGTRLFEEPDHDARAVQRAFSPDPAGEELAKPGRMIRPDPAGAGHVPLAGFFANGEIGPVGGESFLHGHSVSIALFRNAAE